MTVGGRHCAGTTNIWLSDLDLMRMKQDIFSPCKDASVEGNPLVIASQKFTRGIGSHAESYLDLAIGPAAERLSASVGIHDETMGDGSVEFRVYTGTNVAWSSGIMRGGDKAKRADLDLHGVKRLVLEMTDAGDGDAYDHGIWADARIELSTWDTNAVTFTPAEPAVILTPKPPRSPRINGTRVFGVRPGSPFLFTIPATGDRPMTFAAIGLPQGLQLDSRSGRITGTMAAAQRGTNAIMLIARNSLGAHTSTFSIVCGDRIALTPPMGWNSWNCWGTDANEERVRTVATVLVKSGLINHGWTYINLDDGWQNTEIRDGNGPGRFPPTYALQADTNKFPDIQKLVADIHGMGLKFGVYSSPWKLTYANYTGGSADDPRGCRNEEKAVGRYTFEKQDAAEWSRWGVDFLKYDWNPVDIENASRMANALRASGRDIVLSLSNGAVLDQANDWARIANLWRTTGDIADSWSGVSWIGFSQGPWKQYAGPGHWNDPDMLVLGRVGWGDPHPTGLAPNEQYSHMSLWCLLAAPLLLGCDMAALDDFTLGLLENDEVLDVDQDPRGEQAGRVAQAGQCEVWAKTMEDGSKAVGLFNRGLFPATARLDWKDVGVQGPQRVRDLWRQKDIGVSTNGYQADVAGHGVTLVRLWPAAQR